MTQSEPVRTRRRLPSHTLARVTAANPAITITRVTAEGDVVFKVALAEMGLTPCRARQAGLWSSTYVVDLIGEMLVRKNLLRFGAILAGMDGPTHAARVATFDHRHFGVKTLSEGFVQFQLHLSFVQRVLVEDMGDVFRDEVKT